MKVKLMVTLLIMTIIIPLFFLNPVSAWYDDDLEYRDEYTTRASNVVLSSEHNREYDDVTDDVNLSHSMGMANDFSDVVFTNLTDDVLPFYLLSKSDGNWAIFRIKQNIGGNSTSKHGNYYVYYNSKTNKDYSSVRSNAAGTSRASYSSPLLIRVGIPNADTYRGNVIDYTSGNGYTTITDFEFGGQLSGGQSRGTTAGHHSYSTIQVTFRKQSNFQESFGLAMLNTPCSPSISGLNQEKVYSYLDGNTDYNSNVHGLSKNYDGSISTNLPFGTNTQMGVSENHGNPRLSQQVCSNYLVNPLIDDGTRGAPNNPQNVSFGHSFLNISSGINNHDAGESYKVAFVLAKDNTPRFAAASIQHRPFVKFNVIQRTRDGVVHRNKVVLTEVEPEEPDVEVPFIPGGTGRFPTPPDTIYNVSHTITRYAHVSGYDAFRPINVLVWN